MAAGPGGDRDQAVGAFLDGLAGEAVVDDVVQHQAAAGMGGLVDLDAGAERGDPDRHLPAGADLDVALEPDIGAVDDLVDREGGGRAVRVRSEEHTSELQSLMRISYAVFCLTKQKTKEEDDA